MDSNLEIELNKLVEIAKNRNYRINEYMFEAATGNNRYNSYIVDEAKDYLLRKNITIVSNIEDIEDDDCSFANSSYLSNLDVSSINIIAQPQSLDNIIKRIEYDEINLQPDYQRHSGLWSNKQKSLLIESLILKIPLPSFYFDGTDDNKWIVIDGLQRLSTIREFFIEKSLKLNQLDFFEDLNGCYVDNIPGSYIRRMREQQVLCYIIKPGPNSNIVFNIFKRINSGGLNLVPQEIRHSLYQGFATSFLKKLAEQEIFKIATDYSIPTNRMLDREFVLRFLAFYELKIDNYKDNIDFFLNNAMIMLNKKNIEDTEYSSRMEKIFIESLEVCYKIFDRFAFRRMPDLEHRRPINKALFDVWSVTIAKLDYNQRQYLVYNKEILLKKYTELFKNEEFLASISSGKTSSVKKRFEIIKDLVLGVLTDVV